MRPSLRNGLNLAYWLYRAHPGLFNAVQAQALQARARPFGRLGDDFIAPDLLTAPDPSLTDIGVGAAIDESAISQNISPDLVSMPDPELQSVGIDAATTSINIPIDASTAAPASAATPSTSGIGTALANVGGFLASATGLSSLTNLATAYYRANTPQAATLATQIGRVSNGVNPAPITYGYNSSGQLVPVLSQAGVQTPLTPQSLNSLIPSSLTQYAIPIGLGLLLLWALSGRS